MIIYEIGSALVTFINFKMNVFWQYLKSKLYLFKRRTFIMFPEVEIVMGSKSDIEKMKEVTAMLNKLDISNRMSIFSAHRTPMELAEFIESVVNVSTTCKVIIAGAGMSAALAGAIAAQTPKPVIGIPLSGGKFKGVEALLSTLEMPPGIPVLVVGVDATKNAAIAAARIIALNDQKVRENLLKFQDEQKQKVISDNKAIQTD